MRKLKLISAFSVSVAWMVIFLHAVIPHNHHNEHSTGCKSVYHCSHESESTGTATEDNLHQASDEFREPLTEDYSHFICHYQADPFHTLDNDIQFTAASHSLTIKPLELKVKRFRQYDFPFIERQRYLPTSRRGPPLLMG